MLWHRWQMGFWSFIDITGYFNAWSSWAALTAEAAYF
jgi:hypothetical protein